MDGEVPKRSYADKTGATEGCYRQAPYGPRDGSAVSGAAACVRHGLRAQRQFHRDPVRWEGADHVVFHNLSEHQDTLRWFRPLTGCVAGVIAAEALASRAIGKAMVSKPSSDFTFGGVTWVRTPGASSGPTGRTCGRFGFLASSRPADSSNSSRKAMNPSGETKRTRLS